MEKKHSMLGIASFVLSLLTGFALFALIVVAGVLETTTPGGLDENSPVAVIVGLFLFAGVGVEVVAIGLGIAGMFQKNCKIVFAILGTVFSALALLGVVGIIVLGLMMEA
jgi:hypothetical protein